MLPIRLENSVFEGSNSVYLLGRESDGPTTLVDTGVMLPDVRKQLIVELNSADISVSDLDQICLTHYHHDHAGLAGWLQEQSGATVLVHKADAPLVGPDRSAWKGLGELQKERFEEWRIPDQKRQELLDFIDKELRLQGPPAEVTPFEAGDRFIAGNEELEVVHLPGHTLGLCGFATVDTTELFSGDALLPYYTPNVGGADVRVEKSLDKYLDTLKTIANSEFDRVYPGHRDPIEDPIERAWEIIKHHRKRTERVLEILEEHSPIDTWGVSDHLFGELQNIHILHGPGEAHAHLEHLRTHSLVEQRGAEYDLRVSSPDLEELFPTIKSEA